mgnify:CR=1 FL=1
MDPWDACPLEPEDVDGFGITLPTNDLVWWVPFALILLHAWRHHRSGMPERALPLARTLPGGAGR